MEWKVPTHASIIINQEIYFDPYNLPNHGLPNARYIFITHDHYDHYSPADIQKIITPLTKIIVPATMYDTVTAAYPTAQILAVMPGQSYTIDHLSFSTFPAYNLDRPFHPQDRRWVGYNVMIENQRVVVCGDTDATPELLSQPVDLLFIPIGGTYTMDAVTAADVTNRLAPHTVTPIHYGSVVGNQSDAEKFQSLINPNINVVIKLLSK